MAVFALLPLAAATDVMFYNRTRIDPDMQRAVSLHLQELDPY